MTARKNAPGQGEDGVAPRPRVARGERPYFLGNAEVERLLNIVIALTGEVSALHDKLDTVMRLAAAGAPFDADAVDRYEPDADVAADRDARRARMLDRVFRMLLAGEDSGGAATGSYQSVMTELASGNQSEGK